MRYFYYSIAVFILAICFSAPVVAQHQSIRIHGKVLLADSTAAEGATVELKSSKKKVMVDHEGNFILSVIPIGFDTIGVSYTGMQTILRPLQLKGKQDVALVFNLSTSLAQIETAQVFGKNYNMSAKEQVIKAEIVDTRAAQAKASTLVELMNRAAGVRIRQSGGLGSNTNIMLNGFQGKSIKVFKDGIPTDYLGNAFNISSMPVNMLERVEVFKGVLPASLGGDALGGAVNMVSRVEKKRVLALSYEIGSFNTHRLSANLFHNSLDNKHFFGVNSFYNYSDNSYSVIAPVPDRETANVVPTKVKLFHNAFKQVYAEAFFGLRDRSWADEFRLGLTSFYIKRDNQFASLMEKPYGASYNEQYTPVIPTLRYKKGLLNDRLTIDQFLVYSKVNSLRVDTLSGSYDWFGQYHAPVNNEHGESGNPSLLDAWFTNLTSRSSLNYILSDAHQLAFNLTYNAYSRSGKDPYGAKTVGDNPIDLQSLPADYNKAVATLGLSSALLANKLQNVLQAKFYHAHMLGQEVNVSTSLLKEETSHANIANFGLAEALKYHFSPQTFVRFSAEWATRLPEQSEILGDGSFVLSNFDLKPERSLNGNIGFGTGKANSYGVELNTFYRITKDLIHAVPMNLIYTQNVNVEQVRGIGVETDAYVAPLSWLRLNGNFTYQDFRLYHIQDPLLHYLEGARLRNMPFFFANLSADAHFSHVLKRQDQFKVYWNIGYVHQYYLDYIPKDTEPGGFLGLWGKAKVNAPNIIPSQTIQSAGLLWSPSDKGLFSINLECKNIFDKAVYDNFRIQNAGRSCHLKLSCTLK